MEKKLQKLLDIIAEQKYHHFDFLYQGMEVRIDDRTFIYDGGSGSEYFMFFDIYMLYYKGIFFICSENYIMFFEQERLVDYLTGVLDEFWGLFPNDYGPIVYEEDILEMEEYIVNKKAIEKLSESLYRIYNINK